MFIYRIKNIINNKSYIGKCKNLKYRKSTHLYFLVRDKHHSNKLQRAWNRYGEKSFIFEIIEECGPELVCEREKFYIKEYNSYKEGYNCTEGGEIGDNGFKNWKGKFGEDHNVAKEVYQYSKSGNFLRKWGSVIDAARSFGKDRSHLISYCCKGKLKSAYGYIWRYEYEGNKIDSPNIRKGKTIAVKMICPKSNQVIKEFDSAIDAQKFLKAGKNKISEVCKGKRNLWNNYKWKYK